MKKTISFLAFLLFFFTFPQDLKVMTFNIRLSTDSDKENSWDNRKNEVLGLIEYYRPEVLGIQEAVPQQILDMKAGLKEYDFVGVGRDDGENKGEYSPIFFDGDRLEVLKSGTFWLSETPEKPSKGWDAAHNRICTYALFKTKKSGKNFWVFNIHFDHLGNEARMNSSKLILEKINELNPKKLPLILTGDFNSTEESEPMKIISEILRDTFYFSKTPHYGPKGTFTAFDITKIPEKRIDYIFVNGFEVLNNRTINDRRENLLYPSDHFPVMSELRFR